MNNVSRLYYFVDSVSDELGANVSKTDVREAAYVAAIRQPEIVAEEFAEHCEREERLSESEEKEEVKSDQKTSLRRQRSRSWRSTTIANARVPTSASASLHPTMNTLSTSQLDPPG